jgi:hypothetical protein
MKRRALLVMKRAKPLKTAPTRVDKRQVLTHYLVDASPFSHSDYVLI